MENPENNNNKNKLFMKFAQFNLGDFYAVKLLVINNKIIVFINKSYQ